MSNFLVNLSVGAINQSANFNEPLESLKIESYCILSIRLDKQYFLRKIHRRIHGGSLETPLPLSVPVLNII